MNPFTDHSRDKRLALNVEGWIGKLRCPEVIHDLVMRFKPANISVGDHTLSGYLRDAIHTLTVRNEFHRIYELLGTLFELPGARVNLRDPGNAAWDGRERRNGGDRRRAGPHGTAGDRRDPRKTLGRQCNNL